MSSPATHARIIVCLILVLLAGALPAEPIARGVDSVGIPVTDLDRAVSFYHDVLSFTEVSRTEVHGNEYDRLFGVFGTRLATARLALGAEQIVLLQFLTPAGRPLPADSRSNDRWFQHIAIIVRDMPTAYERLRQHHIRYASPAPQRLPDWNPNAGGIEAFYFHDPDGNTLEVLHFPPGKGAAKWHRDGTDLFLGIDHTAIVVADTDASLRYYRDTLGLAIAGTSDNYGPEQERLNNVFGAHLRITALRTGAGPGIELLEYLAPQGGRPLPADSRATDRWHWQVNVITPSASRAYEALRAARAVVVSPTPVALRDRQLGFSNGLLVRDPDGHALLLEEP